ncbi:Mitochondrial substrate/solute carrier [Dillenia turbinata]|uniref:Mitochondrial substrate/solute carrier n=1 Tax=Dillenia turbinata TaxID=194707 RepID=A0AAN8ZFJ8_9MAGN
MCERFYGLSSFRHHIEDKEEYIVKASGRRFMMDYMIVGKHLQDEVVASPADLVKVRMQADGLLVRQGPLPRYSGTFDALSKIIRAEDILGQWRGVFPNIQWAFWVNMGELACYDHAKRLVIQTQISVFAFPICTLRMSESGAQIQRKAYRKSIRSNQRRVEDCTWDVRKFISLELPKP